MTTELNPTEQAGGIEERKVKVEYRGGSSGAVYALGLIGACVYYFSRANSFQEGAIGFLKSLVWPALMVYALMEFLEKK